MAETIDQCRPNNGLEQPRESVESLVQTRSCSEPGPETLVQPTERNWREHWLMGEITYRMSSGDESQVGGDESSLEVRLPLWKNIELAAGACSQHRPDPPAGS